MEEALATTEARRCLMSRGEAWRRCATAAAEFVGTSSCGGRLAFAREDELRSRAELIGEAVGRDCDGAGRGEDEVEFVRQEHEGDGDKGRHEQALVSVEEGMQLDATHRLPLTAASRHTPTRLSDMLHKEGP